MHIPVHEKKDPTPVPAQDPLYHKELGPREESTFCYFLGCGSVRFTRTGVGPLC